MFCFQSKLMRSVSDRLSQIKEGPAIYIMEQQNIQDISSRDNVEEVGVTMHKSMDIEQEADYENETYGDKHSDCTDLETVATPASGGDGETTNSTYHKYNEHEKDTQEYVSLHEYEENKEDEEVLFGGLVSVLTSTESSGESSVSVPCASVRNPPGPPSKSTSGSGPSVGGGHDNRTPRWFQRDQEGHGCGGGPACLGVGNETCHSQVGE